MSTISSINPVTQQTIATYETISDEQLQINLKNSQEAYKTWKTKTYTQRAKVVHKAASLLREHQEKYATLMVQEMGKPMTQARDEIEKCAKVCDYYADNAADFLADKKIDTEFEDSYVAFQPLGTVFSIMPWNFPFWQVFRCAAPALMAGNVVMLKHASNVLGCGEMIAEIWREAGLTNHEFQHLIVDKDQIETIIGHDTVQGVALTGSEGAGQVVGQMTGKYMKRLVLELGGSDPFVVLEDADLDAATDAAITSRIHNSGQTCISAKRFLVVKSIAKEFKKILKEKIAAIKVGNPMEEDTRISAMAREDLAIELQEQVDKSVEMGAISEIEGGHEKGTNYFYPMLLSGIQNDMPAYKEEFFGPVFLFFEVADEEEAVAIANDSDYGLGGTVWSGDAKRGQAVARRIETGAVTINGVMSSDPRIPFGGIKNSGVGRELGEMGIFEFVNKKSIVVKS